MNEDLVKTMAKAMTIQQSTNKSLKKQWRDLDMQLQLTEKELFKHNLDTISGLISEVENFGDDKKLNIKGKLYTQVKDRNRVFRRHFGAKLEVITEYEFTDMQTVVCRTTCKDKDKILAVGLAEAKRNSNSDRGISLKELKSILKKKKFKNINLIKGNIIQTLPKFLNKKKIKISLLHLDLDLFEPTIFALEKLYNKVKKGGIILLDDYKIASGVTKAVNKFKKEKKIEVKKIGNLYYFQI